MNDTQHSMRNHGNYREREAMSYYYTVEMQCHDWGDHILRVLSSPAETKSFPLAPNRMALILSLWKGWTPPETESSIRVTAQSAL